jgi:ribosomal protein L16 Arg81 hydroxylase
MAATDTQPSPVLAREWLRWIATNKVAGAADDELEAELVARGVDPALARHYVEHPDADTLLEVARSQRALIGKHEALLDDLELLGRLGPGADAIEVVPASELPRERFLREYYSANRPVVIEGLLDDSPAMRWSPAYLRERFGDESVEVQTGRRSKPIHDVFLKGKTKTMLLREYVDMVQSAGETNAFYMTGNDGFLSREGVSALWDAIRFGDEYLRVEDGPGAALLWYGPRGAVSPLHRDRVNVLKAQLVGRKRFLMIPACQIHRVYNERSFYSEVDVEEPDLERFPRFRGVRMLEHVLEPGQCLLIPVGWWHLVRSLDVTMSLTFTNFAFPNRFWPRASP